MKFRSSSSSTTSATTSTTNNSTRSHVAASTSATTSTTNNSTRSHAAASKSCSGYRCMMWSFFFLILVGFAITCIIGSLIERNISDVNNSDSKWVLFMHIIRMVFLEIFLMLIVWGYCYTRLTSSWTMADGVRCRFFPCGRRSLREKKKLGTTPTIDDDDSLIKQPPAEEEEEAQKEIPEIEKCMDVCPSPTETFAALLLALWIPVGIIIVYPLGRWYHPEDTNFYQPDPPFFIEVGYAAGAIVLQMLWVTFFLDLLYHMYMKGKELIGKKMKKYDAAAPSSSTDSTSNATSSSSSSSSKVTTAVTFSIAAKPDPEVGVQCESGEEIDAEIARIHSPVVPVSAEAESASQRKRRFYASCVARISLTFDAIVFTFTKIRNASTPHPFPLNLSLAAIAGTIGVSVYGFNEGLQPPHIMRVEIPLARLPASLDGFTIALLSDIHVGQSVGSTRLATAVDIVNSIHPDVVMIAGDLSDAPEWVLAPMLSPLSKLSSKYNRTYLSTGNHEFYEGSVLKKIDLFQRVGVSVLTNQIVPIPEGGVQSETFDLLGVPDWGESKKNGPWARTDLPGTVVGRNASRELVVLAHQPGHGKESAAAGAGLQLSGHVHCGQVMPLQLGAMIIMPYFRGLYETLVPSSVSADVANAMSATQELRNVWHGAGSSSGSNSSSPVFTRDTWRFFVYMSCGTYGYGPLFRQAAPHEVTQIVLRSAAVVGDTFEAQTTAQRHPASTKK